MEDYLLRKGIHKKLITILEPTIKKFEYIAYFITIPYAAIQFLILKENQNTPIKIIKSCLGLVLTIPWILISIILLSILYFYKQIITTILKFKLKNKFHGLIVGIDSVLTLYEEADQTLCYTFIIESQKTEEEFLESLKTRVNNDILSPNIPKRINCVRKYFMGHLYFEEVDDMDADEIIKRISLTKLTHFDFCNEVDKIFQTMAPRNNLFNWDIFWSKYDNNINDKQNTYVMVLRLHHTLGDAMSLYNISSNLFCKMNDTKDNYVSAFNLKKNSFKKFTTKIQNLFELLSNPKNYLIEPIKKGRGIHTFVTESGEMSILEKMRIIRKSVKGVSVLTIFATAYSAALSSHIKRKGLNGPYVPKKVLLITPIQEKTDRFRKYFSNVFCENMGNDFTQLPFFVPFRDETEMDIEERLLRITDNINAVYNSCDYKLIYVIMKSYLELLPNVIYKHSKKFHSAVTIGMAPGGPKLQFFNGDNVKNFTPLLPAIKVNGLAIGAYSYANRFTFMMAANADNFSYEDLTDILNETMSGIDTLYQRFKDK